MKKPFRIAVTTGDVDGIGLEIATKALAKLGPKKDVQFILWRSPKAAKKDLSRLDSRFRRITVGSWPEVLVHNSATYKEVIDINSALPPAAWVETAAQAASLGRVDGLVTAPISKVSIQAAGLKDIGHTDILKRISGAKDVFMGFIGRKFSVVLATGHIPLRDVANELTPHRLELAVAAALKLRELLPKSERKLPIGLLGLNPHAGEDGIIGHDEVENHSVVIEALKKKKVPVEGPLIPDTVFFEKTLAKYSVLVAGYHDQGLIPFKALQPDHANVHITLGLPFIRTSVDHGTAKDIFGKNKADPDSMIRALELAVDLCRAGSTLSLENY